MAFSPIDEIKSRLDIVEVISNYIKLDKAGANYRALCPFHSEKNPSFFVSPARQIWHCFGCNLGGDIFKFVMLIEGLEFGDALRILAQKAGVKLKRQDPKLKTARERLYNICEASCGFFVRQLQQSKKGQEVKEYLLSRGISSESIDEWRIGYAPNTWHGLVNFLMAKGYKREEVARAGLAIKTEGKDNYYDRFRGRIIFPIFDWNSQVVGFGGRITEEQKLKSKKKGSLPAKYINTPQTLLYDKSRILYGLDKAKVEIRKKDACVLVEGYTDVIMSHQAGTKNTVATAGTALTPFHLSVLKRYSENLVLAFDMDIAGDTATKRGIDLAQERGFNIKVALMPKDQDPADVISKSPRDWQAAIKKARSILEFYFQTTFSKFGSKKELAPDDKREISKTLLPVIKRIPNQILQSHWIQNLANRLRVEQQAVLAELKKLTLAPTAEKPGQEQEKEAPSPKSRQELLEERLLVLLFKSPQGLNLIEKEDFSFFSSPVSQAISCFKKNQDLEIAKLEKEVSAEIIDLLNYLSFKAEIEEFRGEEDFEEFEECLKAIKSFGLKKALREVTKEIKEAEEEKNQKKVNNLTQKFNELAQKLAHLD